jgi:hypothetical protein
MSYVPKNKIRLVTAASLFDGHDASINIMRRILQASGAEVIHLGHDRSVQEVVDCAIQEDANAIAVTSYQGGHVEYFKYMYDLLKAGRLRPYQNIWRRRRCYPAFRDQGTGRLRYHPYLLSRRWPRHGPAGHDRRPAPAQRLPHRATSSTVKRATCRERCKIYRTPHICR